MVRHIKYIIILLLFEHITIAQSTSDHIDSNILIRFISKENFEIKTNNVTENDSVIKVNLELRGVLRHGHYINIIIDKQTSDTLIQVENLVYLYLMSEFIKSESFGRLFDQDLLENRIINAKNIRFHDETRRSGTYKDQLLDVKDMFTLGFILQSPSYNNVLTKFNDRDYVSLNMKVEDIERIIKDNDINLRLCFYGAIMILNLCDTIEQRRMVLLSLDNYCVVHDSITSLFSRNHH